MIKDVVLRLSLFILLTLSVTGCAQVKYVMNWFLPPTDHSPSAKLEASSGMSDLEIEKAYKMACYFQERKQYSLSINGFEKVISNKPDYALAHNGMGVSYDLMGDYEKAVQSYQKALALDESLDYVHNNLGYCYSLQGMADQAIEEYKQAIELNPVPDKYHNNLGKAYFAKGSYDLALAEFEKTTDKAGARAMLARLLYKDGAYKEAETQFTEASKLTPEDVEMKKGMKASANLAKINQHQAPAPQDSAEGVRSASLSYDSNFEQGVTMSTPNKVIVKIAMDEQAKTKQASIPVETVQNTPVMSGQKALPSKEKESMVNEKAVSTTEDKASTTVAKRPAIVSLMPVSYDTGIESSNPSKRPAIAESTASKGIAGMIVQLVNDFPDNPLLKKIRIRLIKMGFAVEQVKNSGKYEHKETRLYYCPDRLQEAYQAAKQVPGYQNMDKLKCGEGDGRKILVVIGNDLVPVDHAQAKTSDEKAADRLGG